MIPVSLLRCETYENGLLREKMEEALDLIGFDRSRFKGARVALKPNLLGPSLPEQAVVTHPEFVRAAAQLVAAHGGTPVLMECPATAPLEKTLRKCGYMEVIQEEKLPYVNSAEKKAIQYPEGNLFKRFEISEVFFDVDFILNLPKFKTHGLIHITCAVKNLFGTLPGLDKSRTHMRAPTKEKFAEFLLDLYGALQTGFPGKVEMLHLVDAVVAMEGEGPGSAGTPRPMGVLVAGTDALAVDWVAVQVAGVDVNHVPTIPAGFLRPYGVNSPDEISVLGETIDDVRVEGFQENRSSFLTTMWVRAAEWKYTSRVMKTFLLEKPVPREETCTLCYECMKICPAGAIHKAEIKKKTPRYDYQTCIRCFCCMEACPEAAIEVRKGRLRRFMG